MANKELTAIFSQMADLLEIQDADPFRINSYRKAARSIDDLTEDVADLAAEGRLTGIPGVGKSMTEKILQYLKHGSIDLHKELLASVPKGLPALLDIPGLGPKKVRLLWQRLGIQGVDDLVRALDAGTVAQLPGMGEKSAAKIRKGIEFLKKSAGRAPLGVAWPLAQEVIEALKEATGVKHVEIAGSLRRARETIGDVDLLCAAEDGGRIIAVFTKLPIVTSVLAEGDTKGAVLASRPDGGELQIDLRVVPPDSFGAALQYFTGSKEHNVRLRELAAKKKWKLNEYGLFDGGKRLAGRDEAGIYRKLGLPFLPPEVREDRGEFERASEAAALVTLDDIRGDLHMHTTASDGRNTLEEMVEAARARGYQYIAICDHSQSSAIANGLSADKLLRSIERVRDLNAKLKGFTVFAGTECDILAGGRLDYPDEVLAECDFVVASIHAGLGQDRRTVTERTIAAMRNPYVTIIGHPTGRLLGRREPMDLDIEAVIREAAATGTALEISASWQRLDLKDVHAQQAAAGGAMLAINTDAHSTDQLDMMEYGVRTARRGWVKASSVLNALTTAELRKFLSRKRK